MIGRTQADGVKDGNDHFGGKKDDSSASTTNTGGAFNRGVAVGI